MTDIINGGNITLVVILFPQRHSSGAYHFPYLSGVLLGLLSA